MNRNGLAHLSYKRAGKRDQACETSANPIRESKWIRAKTIIKNFMRSKFDFDEDKMTANQMLYGDLYITDFGEEKIISAMLRRYKTDFREEKMLLTQQNVVLN